MSSVLVRKHVKRRKLDEFPSSKLISLPMFPLGIGFHQTNPWANFEPVFPAISPIPNRGGIHRPVWKPPTRVSTVKQPCGGLAQRLRRRHRHIGLGGMMQTFGWQIYVTVSTWHTACRTLCGFVLLFQFSYVFTTTVHSDGFCRVGWVQYHSLNLHLVNRK